MPTEKTKKTLSYKGFLDVKDELIKKLSAELEVEILMNDFETADENEKDLWATPVVDSKSVIKLSPIVEEMTGHKVKPEWIKPGGYESLEDAVSDLIKHIEHDLKNSED